MSFSIFRYRL